jgi:hypothetical protein
MPATVAALVVALFASGSSAGAAEPATVTVEDYADVATAADLLVNDFSGSVGTFADPATASVQHALVTPPGGGAPVARLAWDFGASGSFAGLFHALFGPLEPPGEEATAHRLDLDDIDAPLDEPGPPRAAGPLRVGITNRGADPVTVKLELKSAQSEGRFVHAAIPGGGARQVVSLDFRTSGSPLGGGDLVRSGAKELVLLVERDPPGAAVNPQEGAVEIDRIWFDLDSNEAMPPDDDALLDLLERRSCQHFLDWSSRHDGSYGLPRDRSATRDKLTLGGAGFALAAYAICAERGWIGRAAAADRARRALAALDRPDRLGPNGSGSLGQRGFLYHFVGLDGTRWQPDGAPDEVEVSTIDTALAVLGALVARAYFDGGAAAEGEIRGRASALYDRVEWPFMFDEARRQFRLSWKPGPATGGFGVPDADGDGHYAGTPADPLTLDFYTDEAAIVSLLAIGSRTHPVAPAAWCGWAREGTPFIRSWPGSLFTYQFLHAFLDTRTLHPAACPGHPPDDWFANSRAAMLAAIEYAESAPFPTYGPDAWGISAAEGPDDGYAPYGVPALAHDPDPPQDGTVTYYAMLAGVSFGDDLRARAVSALRSAWARGHWHPRFGLPDAFHDAAPNAALGGARPWVNRVGYAIDVGPMLLHLENARSGLVWRLLARDPGLRQALARLAPPEPRAEGTATPPAEEAVVQGEPAQPVQPRPFPVSPPLRITRASLRPSRLGRRGRARLRFVLSKPAVVRLTVRRCGPRRRRCRTVRAVSFAGRAGLNVRRLSARGLRPGRHRLVLRAAAGAEHAGPVRLAFRVSAAERR